jgi:hypothetical protein
MSACVAVAHVERHVRPGKPECVPHRSGSSHRCHRAPPGRGAAEGPHGGLLGIGPESINRSRADLFIGPNTGSRAGFTPALFTSRVDFKPVVDVPKGQTMSNLTGKAIIIAVAATAATAAMTTPSHAVDERTFNKRTCAQGSPFIETVANGTVTHRINRPNLPPIIRTYVNGNVRDTDRTGAAARTMSSGRADTDRQIYSARANCAD